MKFDTVQCLAACLLGLAVTSHAEEAGAFQVDLRTGQSSAALPAGITWHSRLTNNVSPCTCDRQGVLKLTFDKESRLRAEINMTFEDSKDWSFHVGDSVSNNGWAGDFRDQDNCGEVHSNSKFIRFYGKKISEGVSYGELYSRDNFVAARPYTTLTMNVMDERVTVDNGHEFICLDTFKIFALNGQVDLSRGGVNYDIFLGMNRVVDGSYRSGSGLCKVQVKFYPKRG